MLWLLTLLLAPPLHPPEPEPTVPSLVVVAQAANDQQALVLVDALLGQPNGSISEDPAGLHYLFGHLLEAVGRTSEASAAFATSISYTPELEQHSRLRLARIEAERGHPEVTAGLTASILRGKPHPALIAETTRLFVKSLDEGGDCRLLTAIDGGALPDLQRRMLDLARADCALAGRREPEAIDGLVALIEENDNDDAARGAADRLLGQTASDRHPRLGEELGRAFHHHRRFDLAIAYLQPEVERLPRSIENDDDFELFYLLARSHFWSEEFSTAAEVFLDLARRTTDPTHKAKAIYQAGRSLELGGAWPEARSRFAEAALLTPSNNWTGPAILSALRIDWRRGHEEEALGTYATLSSRSTWTSFAGQAALFLAASDLVQGRTDRAGAWLSQAASRKVDRTLTDYWQGRLAEAQGRDEAAIAQYQSVLLREPYHPLASDVRGRLTRPPLKGAVARAIVRHRGSTDFAIRRAVWYLSEGDAEQHDQLTQSLYQTLTRSPTSAPFLKLAPTPVVDWPLWTRSTLRLDERLMTLGRWNEVELAPILRLFPSRNPDLAFAAAKKLAEDGATRGSLYIVESLRRRVPSEVPESLLPLPFRQTLYPTPYRALVRSAVTKHGTDPYLLYAIMREESRFDPHALSPAAARGLTQFILPTANRMASEVGLTTPVDPDLLYQPSVAISLGAAYLADLDSEFEGSLPATIAAYNAGEYQSRLWSAYCFSNEEAEYLTKVGFKETAAYLERVLRSRAHYLELYPGMPD
ncbi:MAG: transglycosylase SLT domain-containing protein [Thermoanaerobaculia bacterium]|nr:transglycosylase SLT domain-containing protein [Thermoanaerobaculia bacterium]